MINLISTKRNVFQSIDGNTTWLKRLSRVAGLAVLIVSSQSWAAALQDLQFSALPGDKVEIELTFDQAPPEPSGYSIEKPARISLDLMGVSSELSAKKFSLDAGNARSVTVVETDDRARLIINLDHLVSYRVDRDGNTMVIIVGDGTGTRLASAYGGPQSTGDFNEEKAQVAEDIQEIDFVRGDQDNGQIVVSLNNANADVDMREEGGHIILEIRNTVLPERLRRRLDVSDFATPVQRVDAVQEAGNAKIMIDAVGNYEYLAYQADNIFTLDVKPISASELERKRKDTFMYSGEKLSLNFQDIEVRSVLQLIADFTSLNLVASDTVSGSITLRLQNVPWDQALDLILKTKGLAKRKVGNVMLVAPADEIAAREKLELEANKQIEELAPINSEFLQINYAKAAEIQALLMGGGGEGGNSILSSRGSLLVDERTNMILIQDTVSKIQEVRDVIAVLDIPVRQVLIEARIVIAQTSFSNELGVAWGTTATDFGATNNRYITGNRTSMADNVSGNEIDVNDTMIVDLGVASANATNITLAILDFTHGLLAVEISALEAEGGGEIISTPKVLTADQQTARISSGVEVPYQEAASSGATSVSFKEAVLALEVTPQITPDESIIMDIQVNKDSVGDFFGDSQVPSIATNEIETTVLVDNGETAVLGGIFETQTVDAEVRTPFLGNLPIVGWLFKRTLEKEDKQELLIFITPTIVHNVLSN